MTVATALALLVSHGIVGACGWWLHYQFGHRLKHNQVAVRLP